MQFPSFGHARFAALAIHLAAAVKQGNLDATIESIAKPDEAAHSKNAEELWLAFEALSIRAYFAPNTSRSLPNADDANQLVQLGWKLAAIDPENGQAYVQQLLASRDRQRNSSSNARQVRIVKPEPLSDEQVEVILEILESAVRDSQTGSISQPVSYYSRCMRSWVYDELKSRIVQWADDIETSEIVALQQLLSTLGVLGSQKDLADLMIATEVLSRQSNAARGRSSSGSQRGTLRVRAVRDGKSIQTEITVPMSQRIFSTRFAQYVYMSLQLNNPSQDQITLLIHLRDEVTLFTDHPDRSAAERKLRRALAAFATWWSGDLEHAHQLISELCDDFPEDNDLRNERDRMAAELAAEPEIRNEIPKNRKIPPIPNPFDVLRRKGLHPQPAN